jgi:hypothetical protein
MRPLSVGRVESAFHPAIAHYEKVQIVCKAIVVTVAQKSAADAYLVGLWLMSAVAGPERVKRYEGVRALHPGSPRRRFAAPRDDGRATYRDPRHSPY